MNGQRDPDEVVLWTIYDHPDDYPEHFAARRWNRDGPTADLLLFDSLGALWDHFEDGMGLNRWLPRDSKDDPVVLGHYVLLRVQH